MVKWFGIAIVIVVLLVGGYYLFGNQQSLSPVSPPAENTTGTQPTQGEAMEGDEMNSDANTVALSAEGFSPATLTIKAGTTVTWRNESGKSATVSSDPHPQHTIYPPLNLGPFANGGTHTLVFDKPGTYKYHDHFNPSSVGTIIVE